MDSRRVSGKPTWDELDAMYAKAVDTIATLTAWSEALTQSLTQRTTERDTNAAGWEKAESELAQAESREATLRAALEQIANGGSTDGKRSCTMKLHVARTTAREALTRTARREA